MVADRQTIGRSSHSSRGTAQGPPLVGGYDVLYGKVKAFMRDHLFATSPVDLEDPVVLRNLSEPAVGKTLYDAFKTAINALTIQESGTTRAGGLDQAARHVAVPHGVPSVPIFDQVGVLQDSGERRVPVVTNFHSLRFSTRPEMMSRRLQRTISRLASSSTT